MGSDRAAGVLAARRPYLPAAAVQQMVGGFEYTE
jgi:hypothetical protein